MKSYLNFIVELSDYKAEGKMKSLKSRVLESPAGAQRSGNARVEFPVQLEGRLKKLERRELALEELIVLGEELAKLLLPPAVRDFFRRSKDKAINKGVGLRVQIRADSPELGQIPWEYTYLGKPDTPTGRKGHDGFLALDSRISLVRFEIRNEPEKAESINPVDGLRIAAVLSDVQDPSFAQLNLSQEEVNLRQALERVDGVDLSVLRPGRLEQLEELLTTKGAQIFHFAGHGEFNLEMGEKPGTFEGKGNLILAGDDGRSAPLEANKLALELSNRGIRLAMLGACEAAGRDPVTMWSGVATALVREGIPAVIGMQYTVRDGNAVAFSRRFYQALASGKSIDTAVTEGRLGIFNRGGSSERDWGVPVLYLNTDRSLLFPKPIKPMAWNLALATVALLFGGHWFFNHISPMFVQSGEQLSERVNWPPGVATAWLALVGFLWSRWKKQLDVVEQSTLFDRILHHRDARNIMGSLCLVAVILAGTTNSIYLSGKFDNTEAITFKLESSDGTQWGPTLKLPAGGETLSGKPVFFSFAPRDLTLKMSGPDSYTIAEDQLKPHPIWFRSTQLKASDVIRSKDLRVVRVVPYSGFNQLLLPPEKSRSEIDCGPESQSPQSCVIYKIKVRIDDIEYSFHDLRKGVVYFGGSEVEMSEQLKAENESSDTRAAALKNCVDGAEDPDDEWNPENPDWQHLVKTPIIGPDQTVSMELFAIKEGVESKIGETKTWNPGDLGVGIENSCLSN
jgi:hypothetical protein